MKPINTVEIRPDYPPKFERMNIPITQVDEIVIGDWLHLERMDGTNRREWSLIVSNGDKEYINIAVTEKDGEVKKVTVVECSCAKQ